MSTLRVNNIQFNPDGNTIISAVNTNNIVITVDGTEKLKVSKEGVNFRGPISVNNTPIFGGSGELIGLPASGALGNVLTSNGTAWTSQTPTINLQSTQITNTLQVANGGTGLTAVGTSGNVLTSDGTSWISQTPPITNQSFNNFDIITGTSANTNWTVPAGVYTIRAYAIGKGGNSGGVSYTPSTLTNYLYYSSLPGAGGGMAFGNIAVTPGQNVNCFIANGIARVNIGSTELLTAFPGANGNTKIYATNITGTTVQIANSFSRADFANGGTALIDASVTKGGAYTGGSLNPYYDTVPQGTANTIISGIYSGASAASPLGAGHPQGFTTSYGGHSPGGTASINNYNGMGMGGTDDGFSGPNYTVRQLQNRYNDPLLRHATGETLTPAEQWRGSYPGPGAGGFGILGPVANMTNSLFLRTVSGGDFGGGAGNTAQPNFPGGGSFSVTARGKGGFLAGGGAVIASISTSDTSAISITAKGGDGGIGGGAGGAQGYLITSGGASSTKTLTVTQASGGAAAIVIAY